MTVFEIVLDVVGADLGLKLMDELGGHVFYIPKRPAQNEKLRRRVEHYRNIGYSEEQIIAALCDEVGITRRSAKKKMNIRSLFDEY